MPEPEDPRRAGDESRGAAGLGERHDEVVEIEQKSARRHAAAERLAVEERASGSPSEATQRIMRLVQDAHLSTPIAPPASRAEFPIDYWDAVGQATVALAAGDVERDPVDVVVLL